MNNSAIKSLARISGAIICCACACAAFGQFGFWGKIDAKLSRKRPPQVYLHDTAVKLEVETITHRGRDYRPQIQSRLESGLFAQDTRLRPAEPGRVGTFIVCKVTRLDADDNTWVSRKETERKKVGEQQRRNPKNGKIETDPIFKDVEVTRRYRIVKGGISISYKALDAKRNVLDAHNIEQGFSKEYAEETAAPTEYEVCEQLVNAAVDQLVMRLTPTTEVVKVFLPKGKAENFSKLGEAGLWEKMYEGLDKMGEQQKPEDEAYRRFGLGVADEAKAYAAADPRATWEHLMEASAHYNKAIELKPGEKYFREPLVRIGQAIEQYKKLADQQADYARAKSLPEQAPKPRDPSTAEGSKEITKPTIPAPIKPANTPPAAKPKSAGVTNQQVIDLLKKAWTKPI